MENVKESLFSFEDDKFFKSLNETEGYEISEGEEDKEDNDEMDEGEKKKLAAQIAKDGQQIIKKLLNNFKQFKKEAGSTWQTYRDFWSAQKDADETIGQNGIYYNLWNSDYIAGVVEGANGSAELKIFNTSQKDTDEFETFVCKNPDVILSFNDFFKNTVEASMKEVITAHKAAMAAKKEADKLQAKEDKNAVKRAKLDAFLTENLNEGRDWKVKLDITDAVQNAMDHEDWSQYRDELVSALENQAGEIEAAYDEHVVMQSEDIVEELKNADDEEAFEWVLSELMFPWAEDNDIFLAQFGEMQDDVENHPWPEEDGPRGQWTDPAGGVHDDDEEDPAAMYR